MAKKIVGTTLARAILDGNKKKLGTIARYIREDKTGLTEIGTTIGNMKEQLANQFSEIFKGIRSVVAGDQAEQLPDDLITLSLGENADDQGIIKYTFKPMEKFPGIENASVSLKVGSGSTEGKYKLEVETENGDALKELVPEDLTNVYGDLEVANLDNTFKDFGTDLTFKYFEAFKKILGDTEAKPAIDKDVNTTFFDTLKEKMNQKFLDNPAFEANSEVNLNYNKNIFSIILKKDNQPVMDVQYIYSNADKAFDLEHATGANNVGAIGEVTADNIDAFIDALATDVAALGLTAPEKPAETPPTEKPAETPSPTPAASTQGNTEPKAEDKKADCPDCKGKKEDKDGKKCATCKGTGKVDSKEEAKSDGKKEAGIEKKEKENLKEIEKDLKSIEKGEKKEKELKEAKLTPAEKKDLEKEKKDDKKAEKEEKADEKKEKAAEAAAEKAGEKKEKKEDKPADSAVKPRLEYKVGDEVTVDGKARKVEKVDDKNITYKNDEGKEVTVPIDSFTEQTAVMNANEVVNFKDSQLDSTHMIKINKYTEDVDDVPEDSQEVLFAASEEEGKEIIDIIKNEGVLAGIKYLIDNFGDEMERGNFTTDPENDLEFEEGIKLAKTNMGETIVYNESTNEVIFMKRFNKRTYVENIDEYHSKSFMEAKKAKSRKGKRYGAKVGASMRKPMIAKYKGYRGKKGRMESRFEREPQVFFAEGRRGRFQENTEDLIDRKIMRKVNPKKFGRNDQVLYTQPTAPVPGVGGAIGGHGGGGAMADKRRGRMPEHMEEEIIYTVTSDRFSMEPFEVTKQEFIDYLLEMNKEWETDYTKDDVETARNKRGNPVLIVDGEIVAESFSDEEKEFRESRKTKNRKSSKRYGAKIGPSMRKPLIPKYKGHR